MSHSELRQRDITSRHYVVVQGRTGSESEWILYVVSPVSDRPPSLLEASKTEEKEDQMDSYPLNLSKYLEPKQIAQQLLLGQIPPIFTDHEVVSEPPNWTLFDSIEVHAPPLHDDLVEFGENGIYNS